MDAPDPVAPQVTLRCGFCLTLNRIDLERAGDRPTCGNCARPMLLDRPLKVAEEDFEATVLGAGAPVIVDFFADWCGPCRMAAPVMDEIAGTYIGRLLVAKIDTDRAPSLSARYQVRSIPTTILFEDGQEISRVVGFDAQQLREMATRAVG